MKIIEKLRRDDRHRANCGALLMRRLTNQRGGDTVAGHGSLCRTSPVLTRTSFQNIGAFAAAFFAGSFMPPHSLSTLGQNELIQLALEASKREDAATARDYLKEAVARPDTTAIAHFLLGAEYAQARMYEDATVEWEAAVVMDPALAIARFQLGLLQLTNGNAARAMEVLCPLAELGEEHELAQFAAGLAHLACDEFSDAALCLRRGIELNTSNAALNGDMQKILDQIAHLSSDDMTLKDRAEEESGVQHLFLSAYKGKLPH